MSTYKVSIQWINNSDRFLSGKYSRKHKWILDGGIEIIASSSPAVVPVPFSEKKAIDPEESFVCSISSCHMLWFLDLASKNGLNVKKYTDRAVGVMKSRYGKMQITNVYLHPKIDLQSEEIVNKNTLMKLHEEAHEKCFIANSVKTEINVII